jgi:hypothetical protein
MPDIDKINNVAVASISKLDAVTFADGQKVNNQDVSLVTDAHVLISTHTVPDDYGPAATCEIDITSGIDSTYDVYQWVFTNMHPESEDGDNRQFMFQVNAAGGSGFNETITSTAIDIYHNEAGTAESLGYNGARDQGQGTAYQPLIYGVGADGDQSCSGVLTLYGPASTTYVKHFTAVTNGTYYANYTMQNMMAGYINTTSAIDEISFKFNSDNIDAGVIKMYGIAKS